MVKAKDDEEKSEPKQAVQGEPKKVVFWSRQEKCRLANFRPEKREGGMIVEIEQSLPFEERMLITTDPEKIEFVRNHPACQNGDVVECASIEEAQAKTKELRAMRMETNFEDKFESISGSGGTA